MIVPQRAAERARYARSMPAMIRRIKPGWAVGLPALGAVLAFIVLAGTCDRTYSGQGVTFKYPARARITVQYETITCEQDVYCPPHAVLITDENSGSSLWIDAVKGTDAGRLVRTENGADPADVNAMFDLIVETVRIKESGNQ